MIPAITAEPIEPPMVRMLAFMPLATPVCSGGHRRDDHAGQAGEDQPGADALDRRGGVQLPGVVVEERRSQTNAAPVTSSPVVITARAPTRRIRRRGREADQEAGHRRGQQQVARLGDRGAEAVAGLAAASGAAGAGSRTTRTSPKPTQPATTLAVHTPRRRIICMSIIGTGTRSSTATQAAASTHARARTGRAPRARPSPTRCPRSARAAARPATRPAARRAAPAAGPACAPATPGTKSSAAAAATSGHHHRQPEQPAVAERVDDRAGHHDADAEPHRGQRRDHAQRHRHPLAELVADDPEGQRQHPAAHALERPAPRSASRCSAPAPPPASRRRARPARPRASGSCRRRRRPGRAAACRSRRRAGRPSAPTSPLSGVVSNSTWMRGQHRHDQRLQQGERRGGHGEHGEGDLAAATQPAEE